MTECQTEELDVTIGGNDMTTLNTYLDFNYETFDYSEERKHSMECDFDPETNFFHTMHNECRYYTEQQFSVNVKMVGAFSILHINSRSLIKNFSKLYDFLRTLKTKFSAVAVSETWLTDEIVKDYELQGYHMFYVNRRKKRGGGVALYVDETLQCKQVKNMSKEIDDKLEIVTAEIEMERAKNIIISCVYKAPTCGIEILKEQMIELYEKITNKKIVFVCGDFNVDLLNPQGQIEITDFINTMYSIGLFPRITKPSRITRTSATLIDNIYSNIMDATVGGLFIQDISDHLPIFTTFHHYPKGNLEKKKSNNI